MYGLPGGVSTQCNILTGSNTIWNCIVTDRKSSITVRLTLLVANQLFATSKFLKYVYDIEKVLLWMDINFSMFLNFFDVISIFFRSFFDVSFLCLVFLCFVFSVFLLFYVLSFYVSS